jgi:uncharacterized protein Yka (UPF0111/DUF47 family)
MTKKNELDTLMDQMREDTSTLTSFRRVHELKALFEKVGRIDLDNLVEDDWPRMTSVLMLLLPRANGIYKIEDFEEIIDQVDHKWRTRLTDAELEEAHYG